MVVMMSKVESNKGGSRS